MNYLYIALLIGLGVLGNMFSIELFFGVNFLFGSIASLIALYLFGLRAGFLVALVSSSYTYILWNHPYAMIIFVIEIIAVYFISKKLLKSENILIADLIFWTSTGGFLVYIFYSSVMGMSTNQVFLIALKQGINGVFNSLVALLVLQFILNFKFKVLRFREMFLTVLGFFILVPLLTTVIISSNRVLSNSQKDIAKELKANAKYISSLIKDEQDITKDFLMKHRVKEVYEISLFDKNANLLLTTSDNLMQGKLINIKDNIYHIVSDKKMPSMLKWKKSFYSIEYPLNDKILEVRLPAKLYLDRLENIYIVNLAIMYILVVISFFVAFIVSKLVLKPLYDLRDFSKTLPAKIENQEAIEWSETKVKEINSLIDTFQTMTSRLKDSFSDIREINSSLEVKVTERTKELSEVNQKLKELNSTLKTRVTQEVEKNRAKDKLMIKHSRQAAMGEMIGMIAHQWRQPITAIGISANNMLLDIDLDDIDSDDFKESLEVITTQVQFLSKTIDDFRNFFKPNKEQERVLISEVLNESISIIGKNLENSNIKLTLDFKDETKINLFKNELIQVFLNIIKNAQDVLKEKSIENASINIESFEDSETITVLITDNGGGVENEVIDRVFDPYFSTKNEKNGTGLGLYMSKMIIEDHLKGVIKIYNRDSGAVLDIKIPKEN